MGVTIRQKIKGKGNPWWVFITHTGKRKSIKAGSKDAALALADKIREKLAGAHAVEKLPTFGEYARKILNSQAQHLKYSTHVSYDTIFRRHVGPLLDKPLDQIRRSDLKDLIAAKTAENLAPKTVANIKAFVSTILSHAHDDELIPANVSFRMGKHLPKKERRHDVNPLTRDEARLFLDTVQTHYPRYYPFFLCALRTGLRLGELQALTWGNVDFHGHFIEVRHGYTKRQFTTPKSGKSRRVDMSPQLAETLRELLTARKAEALAKGWGEVPELVFVGEKGGVIDEANLRKRVFHRALEKAGLRQVRIHDLRHTFAGLLIQNGESLAYVRDQMGHSSIQITVDTYGHLVPGAHREAVAKLDNGNDTYGPSDRVHIGPSPPPKK